MAKADSYRDLVKFGVENSSTPVSKAAQGSKRHKMDVITYINKMNEIYGNGKESVEPKVADQKIFKNNINNKKPVAKLTNKVPVYKYPTRADSVTFGKAAERIERARQESGSEISTWDLLKKAADTPQEKKEIREIIREDYKKNGPKNMSQDDLAWIGKSRVQEAVNAVKIDVSGISDSINNYINATKIYDPVPPKKQRDPDLDLGLASLIGGSNEF